MQCKFGGFCVHIDSYLFLNAYRVRFRRWQEARWTSKGQRHYYRIKVDGGVKRHKRLLTSLIASSKGSTSEAYCASFHITGCNERTWMIDLFPTGLYLPTMMVWLSFGRPMLERPWPTSPSPYPGATVFKCNILLYLFIAATTTTTTTIQPSSRRHALQCQNLRLLNSTCGQIKFSATNYPHLAMQQVLLIPDPLTEFITRDTTTMILQLVKGAYRSFCITCISVFVEDIRHSVIRVSKGNAERYLPFCRNHIAPYLQQENLSCLDNDYYYVPCSSFQILRFLSPSIDPFIRLICSCPCITINHSATWHIANDLSLTCVQTISCLDTSLPSKGSWKSG